MTKLLLILALALPGCGLLGPARAPAKTANDVAQAFCAAWNARRAGISAEEAVDKFCATEAQLAPWLKLVLGVDRAGGTKAEECSK